MQLKLFKTFWGWQSSYAAILEDLIQGGFNGLEAPAPQDSKAFDQLGNLLGQHKLDYIAEICTSGSYVADRRATPAQHLADLEEKIVRGKPLTPRFFNVMAGCDAWPLEMQVDFFSRALDIGDRHQVTLSFETHRGRSFFNPWITRDVIRKVPDLWLTCDFSHWHVVCERLIDTEWDTILELAPRGHHIHGRVGYDQGPQVPHPADPAYASFLQFHQRCWEQVWQEQMKRGVTTTTMTPESGPDGYTHRLPFTGAPIDDFAEINRWMAKNERQHFAAFMKEHPSLPVAA